MLVRLYSETKLFSKPYKFESGLNIILGKYSNGVKQAGVNGIGKSSLIRLIDFALLSGAADRIFKQSTYEFLRKEEHNIILEFKIASKTYYIKRYFHQIDVVYFGTTPKKFEEFTITDLKTVLLAKLFPIENDSVFFVGDRLGTLMDFYIKDDLETLKRDDPFNFSKGTSGALDKAIFNFFLMGLPTRSLIEFKEIAGEYKEFFDTIKGLENQLKIDTGMSLEEFRSARIPMEKNIKLLEQSLTDYKFLEKYKNIEVKLVQVTSLINEQLKEYHALNNKLKKIQDSFQYNQEVNVLEIRKLYNEVFETFGDKVSKTLEEITEFKKEILSNRNKYLLTKERELEKSIEEVLDHISKLEVERSELYKILEEKGALDTIKKTYEQLTEEKTNLVAKMQSITQIEEIQTKLSDLTVTISSKQRDIVNEIKANEGKINDLREFFLDILQQAIHINDDSSNGFFDIAIKNKPSRNQLPFNFEVSIPKTDALGASRLKLVAYDFMVFLKSIYENRQLPTFLLHDGVYHGISLETKIKSLNYMYHQHLANPKFQYIVTFNEDEIYIPEEKKELVGKFDFEFDSVVRVELTDSPEGMLFQRDFK